MAVGGLTLAHQRQAPDPPLSPEGKFRASTGLAWAAQGRNFTLGSWD